MSGDGQRQMQMEREEEYLWVVLWKISVALSDCASSCDARVEVLLVEHPFNVLCEEQVGGLKWPLLGNENVN